MSKATLSTEFRQVDVDELDEEKFVDEPDTTGVQGDDEDDQISQREQEVKKLSQGGNNMEALKVALSDPPTGCKDKSLKVTSYKLSLKAELIHGRKPGNKERNFNIVLDVLTRFRSSEVDKAVKSLNSDEVDVLMKYIYRGFAYPTENSCGILLVWHEKALTAGGLGSIVRVMTDRKTV